MTTFKRSRARILRSNEVSIALLSLALCSVAGCASSLLPTPAIPPALFVLDDGAGPGAASTAVPGVATNRLTLMVSLPKAAPGFEGAQIVYQKRANELESFAHSEWVDTPARMLAPLIRRAMVRTGEFGAVIDSSTVAAADLRLDSEIVRLKQDFTRSPSRAELTLLVTVIDLKTRRIVASRQFDATELAVTDDPHGSVEAANRVVARVLVDAADFVAGSASHR